MLWLYFPLQTLHYNALVSLMINCYPWFFHDFICSYLYLLLPTIFPLPAHTLHHWVCLDTLPGFCNNLSWSSTLKKEENDWLWVSVASKIFHLRGWFFETSMFELEGVKVRFFVDVMKSCLYWYLQKNLPTFPIRRKMMVRFCPSLTCYNVNLNFYRSSVI